LGVLPPFYTLFAGKGYGYVNAVLLSRKDAGVLEVAA
jgi:hypothetical protein